MSTLHALAVASVASLAVLARANAYYPPEAVLSDTYTKASSYFVGYDQRKCTTTGDRCSGEKGYEHVQYAPCCNPGDVCVPMKDLSWGSFCTPPPKDYITCYAAGARCVGAEGYEHVPYFPCCDGYPAAKKGDWGEFCYVPPEYKKDDYYVYYVPEIEVVEKKFGYKYVGSYEETYAPKSYYPGYKEEYKTYYETTPKDVYYYPKKAFEDKMPKVSPEW